MFSTELIYQNSERDSSGEGKELLSSAIDLRNPQKCHEGTMYKAQQSRFSVDSNR